MYYLRVFLKHQLCVDTACSLEDLPGVMDCRSRWWERESGNSVLSEKLDEIFLNESWFKKKKKFGLKIYEIHIEVN